MSPTNGRHAGVLSYYKAEQEDMYMYGAKLRQALRA